MPYDDVSRYLAAKAAARQALCSLPMELRAKAIETRDNIELCALLMAVATELERLRGFARRIAGDDGNPRTLREAARKMLEGAR